MFMIISLFCVASLNHYICLARVRKHKDIVNDKCVINLIDESLLLLKMVVRSIVSRLMISPLLVS